MNICILFHSETGTTKAFANAVQKELEQIGHRVVSQQLVSKAPVKKTSVREAQQIAFEALPDPAEHDVLLFGGPVWAFGPSPAIVAAIRQMGLSHKTCAAFASMGFPFTWMGGSSALKYMERELRTKGATVRVGSVCNGRTKNNPQELQSLAAKLASEF